jgi:hypothetical protein
MYTVCRLQRATKSIPNFLVVRFDVDAVDEQVMKHR